MGLSLSIAIFFALSSYVAYQFGYDFTKMVINLSNQFSNTSRPSQFYKRAYPVALHCLSRIRPSGRSGYQGLYEEGLRFQWKRSIVDQDMLFVDSSFLRCSVRLVSGSIDPYTAPKSVMISNHKPRHISVTKINRRNVIFQRTLAFMVTGVFERLRQFLHRFWLSVVVVNNVLLRMGHQRRWV
jgi:hypothetical protein